MSFSTDLFLLYNALPTMGRSTTTKMREAEGNRFIWWFLAAMVLSAVIHGIFLGQSRRWKVGGFSPEAFDEIVPRTFRMKRVEIDPETMKEEPTRKTAEERVHPGSLPVPQDRPSVTDGILEKKKSLLIEHDELPMPENAPSAILEKSPSHANVPSLIEGISQITAPSQDPLEDLKPESGTAASGVPPAGFSSLDGLLEGNQPISEETAPILMPTDLLFEYDSATLRKEAEMALKKLATLMNRNPQAGIRIDGHTDSFGGDDYNQSLSLRRAEEVKRWLVANADVSANRITTAGLGKTRLLAPATGTIGEQQLNRRVEIIITQGGNKP